MTIAARPDTVITGLPKNRGALENLRRTLARAPVSAWFGMVVIALYVGCAMFAPLVAPFGEGDNLGDAYADWGAPVTNEAGARIGTFLLGSDQLGRDILSRLIYGARNTIGIALATTLISFLVGGTLGMLVTIRRGWVDIVVSRLVDTLMSIPTLIFALMLLTVTGTSVFALVLIIALLDSTRVFRLSRALAFNVVVMDYVEAARLRGERLGWLIRREILPNILPPLIAEFGLRFCFVFLTISALSFLGVGLSPESAVWGSMVAENATLISYENITPLLPAAAIALLTVAVNVVVDWFLDRASGLRDGQ